MIIAIWIVFHCRLYFNYFARSKMFSYIGFRIEMIWNQQIMMINGNNLSVKYPQKNGWRRQHIQQ